MCAPHRSTYFISPAFHDPTTVKDHGRDKESGEKKQPVTFVMLQAPAFVPPEQFDLGKSLPTIKTTFAEAEKLDIVVGSAAGLNDKHSMVNQSYIKKYGLQNELDTNCTGAML